MGFVASEEREGKEVYSITAAGESYLRDNEDVVSPPRAGQEYAGRIGEFGFMSDLRDLQEMLMMNAEYIGREKMKAIQEIAGEARRKVAVVVFGYARKAGRETAKCSPRKRLPWAFGGGM